MIKHLSILAVICAIIAFILIQTIPDMDPRPNQPDTVVITWVMKECTEIKGAEGCAGVSPSKTHCTIIAPSNARNQVLGHELKHCFGWVHHGE